MRGLLASLALVASPAAAQETSYSPMDRSDLMTVSSANATIASLQSADRVLLNDITLSETAVIAISAGPRTLTVSTNCQVGDRMFMSPSAQLPAGYMLGDIFCSTAGTAKATLFAPLLSVGGNYSFTIKVTAFR